MHTQYESFSRHLREKYSTRLHVADQLADRLKEKNPSAKSVRDKSDERRRTLEPYFNECIRAAERVRKNRRSARDRQICYENLILAEKLERIKHQSTGPRRNYLEKLEESQFRTSEAKVNGQQQLMKLMRKDFVTKQFLLLNEKTSDSLEKQSFETARASRHSPSSIESGNQTSEDDQATAADMDESMSDDSSIPLVADRKHARHPSSKHHDQRLMELESVDAYQHLNQIDMTMIRDTVSRSKIAVSAKKHFSICILPRGHSDVFKTKSDDSKIPLHDRQYAFKREILYSQV